MIQTEHFTFSEFVMSSTAIRHGIDNTPSQNLLPNIKRTLDGLERIRSAIGLPIHINSGFRCDQLNRLMGSHKSSQHLKGQAADIIAPKYGNPYKLALAIVEDSNIINFDSLILEFGHWVHISFTAIPRNSVFTIRNLKEGYIKGLVL